MSLLKNKKILLGIAAFILLLVFIAYTTNIGFTTIDTASKSSSEINQHETSNTTSNSVEQSKGFNSAVGNVATADSSASSTDVKNKAKIVKTDILILETLRFDDSINSILAKCNELSGYVETSNISGKRINSNGNVENRNASLKLRIPKDKYSIFKTSFKGLGNIINDQETGENITQQYFDTDAHLNSLKIQEERLLDLLKKSGDLKTILDIEKELQNVRFQIESLTTTLKNMDSLVDYATFNININEVQEIKTSPWKPVSLSDKITTSFKASINLIIELCKSLILLVSYILPLVIFFAFCFAIYILLKRIIVKIKFK